MKTKLTKLFSLLMAGALVLSLAACSGAGDDANTTGAEESNQAPNASETFPPASDESKNPSDSTAEPVYQMHLIPAATPPHRRRATRAPPNLRTTSRSRITMHRKR